MLCKNCGKELGDHAVYCDSCGTAVDTTGNNNSDGTVLSEDSFDKSRYDNDQGGFGSGAQDQNGTGAAMENGYNNGMNDNNGYTNGNGYTNNNGYNNDNGYNVNINMDNANSGNYQQNMRPAKPDNGGFGWCLLGFCIPIVGLVLWLVWKDEKPITAKSAGKGALISVIFAIVCYAIYFIVLIGIFSMSSVIL